MHSPLTFTTHARTMMHERMIREDWVINTVNSPDRTEERLGDEKHYLKQIPQAGGKTLRVIINPTTIPPRIITVFFDRRVQP
jgi:hypothetical protein